MNEQSPHTDIVNDWIIGYLTNSLTPERDAVVTELAECFGRKPEIFFRYARSMDRCF